MRSRCRRAPVAAAERERFSPFIVHRLVALMKASIAPACAARVRENPCAEWLVGVRAVGPRDATPCSAAACGRGVWRDDGGGGDVKVGPRVYLCLGVRAGDEFSARLSHWSCRCSRTHARVGVECQTSSGVMSWRLAWAAPALAACRHDLARGVCEHRRRDRRRCRKRASAMRKDGAAAQCELERSGTGSVAAALLKLSHASRTAAKHWTSCSKS